MRTVSNFMFIDAIIEKERLKVLYIDIDKYYVIVIDTKENKLIEKKQINVDLDGITAGLNFYSFDMIYYLTKDNKIKVEGYNIYNR